MTAEPQARPRASRSAMGIALVLTAQMMLVLDSTVVTVALPRIQSDLEFTPAGLSWVLNGYVLAFGGLLLFGGRLGDVLGRRRVFEAGVALFTLSSLAGGLAPTAELLVAARVLQGIGAAIAAPSVLALLTTSAADEAARNRGLALFTAVSSIGGSVGLILGGFLTDIGSWRWTLIINVPLGLAILALAHRVVGETERQPGRFDILGAAAATLGSVSAVYALISVPAHGWGSPETLGGAVAAMVLLIVFARTERTAAHPLLRLSLLHDRQRVGGLVMTSLLVGGQFATMYLLVLFIQGVLRWGPLASGLAFLPLTVAMFAGSTLAARLLPLLGPTRLLIAGTLGLVPAFIWLGQLSTTSEYATSLLGPLLLCGASAGLAFVPATVVSLANIEPEHAGAGSGLLQTMQQLGGAVGLAVVVSVYASGAVEGQVVPGTREAFLTAAMFAAAAFAVAVCWSAAATGQVRDFPQP